jgi:hypothetical protein
MKQYKYALQVAVARYSHEDRSEIPPFSRHDGATKPLLLRPGGRATESQGLREARLLLQWRHAKTTDRCDPGQLRLSDI